MSHRKVKVNCLYDRVVLDLPNIVTYNFKYEWAEPSPVVPLVCEKIIERARFVGCVNHGRVGSGISRTLKEFNGQMLYLPMWDQYVDECMASIHNIYNRIKSLSTELIPDWYIYKLYTSQILILPCGITRWRIFAYQSDYLSQYHPNIIRIFKGNRI